METFGLRKQELEAIIATLKGYNEITAAKIFGSRAMGTQRHNSDIDIVIYGDIPDSRLASLLLDLDEISCPYTFDVISDVNIDNPNMREHIARFGKLICQGHSKP